jgi:cytochrome c553
MRRLSLVLMLAWPGAALAVRPSIGVQSVSIGGLAQSPAAPQGAPPAGDAAAGRRAFMEYACYFCHGTAGQGSLPTVGPRVARVPRSLDSLRSYVRRPTGRMSSYPDVVISDAVFADIYAYLRAVPEPPTPLPPALAALRKR